MPGSYFILLQILSVGGDHVFVPVEAVLFIAFAFSHLVVGTVHVDKAVPLGDAVAGREQVKSRPRVIAQDLRAVFNGSLDRLDVLTDILDPVGIMDGPVGLQLVIGAKAILADSPS